jgi:hypothetical protein
MFRELLTILTKNGSILNYIFRQGESYLCLYMYTPGDNRQNFRRNKYLLKFTIYFDLTGHHQMVHDQKFCYWTAIIFSYLIKM